MPSKKEKDEAAVVEKIASWDAPYRTMGERLHQIIMEANPSLSAKLWYGMPGYATNGPVLCFFRHDDMMTFGLTEKVDFPFEENTTQLMASSWFFTELDNATEKRIAEIVSKATG